MNEFEPGDIVQIKSGGPKMVIEGPGKEPDSVICVWQDLSGKKTAEFPNIALCVAD